MYPALNLSISIQPNGFAKNYIPRVLYWKEDERTPFY